MQLLISAIEEVIYQKKQSVRYATDELNNVSNRIAKDTGDIARLEFELSELKSQLNNNSAKCAPPEFSRDRRG